MQQLDAISRNVANVNTQGYKREIYLNRGFQSYLDTSQALVPGAMPAIGALPVAADAYSSPDARIHEDIGADADGRQPLPHAQDPTQAHDFSSGTLKFTGSALSLAIEGKGYFQLQTPHGIVLTRDGQFKVDPRGQLVAADGSPLLIRGGISLDQSAAGNAELKVLADGTLSLGEQRAQIDLVDAEPSALQPAGPSRYRAAVTSELKAGTFQVRQGFSEGSNVDTLTEMVDMMSVVRHVEAQQQVIRAYDEVIDNAVSTLGQF